jgi:HlyD family secretion protein
VEAELQKLRIDKAHKARRDERQVWPWVVVGLVVLLGGAGLWQWRTASAAPRVQTVRVRFDEGAGAAPNADDGERVALTATGYVMAAHKIELASKVVGRVAWVDVEMGDKIAKDQVLVRLEDDEYKARVAQAQGQLDNAKALLAELEAGSRPQEVAAAEARLEQAQAELANAESNLKRLQELAPAGNVGRQELNDAETLVRSRTAQVAWQRQQVELARIGPRKEQIDAQRATVRQLEGALAMAQIDLGNTVIRSPIPATVLERNVEVGEFLTTGFVGDRGAKGYVVSIADLGDLRVEVDVSQNDFAKIAPRQPCSIVTDAYPDKKYAGVVDLISPEANRQKATVQVRVKVLDPDELLKPSMNATVSFLAPRAAPSTRAATTGRAAERRAVRVPASAVRDGAVFVVENGKAVRRAVDVARAAGGARDVVEVRTGLIGGEDVIVSPPETLRDGARVVAQEAKS